MLDSLKRTAKEAGDDKLTRWAAALTYYAVLSIFPALLAVISILGLIGSGAIQPLIDNLTELAPNQARDIIVTALQNLQGSQGTAGILFVVGLLGAIWSASGYVGAFMDASNEVWEVEEGRPIWKKLPIRVGITVALLVLLVITAVAVAVTGPLASEVGSALGLGSTAVTIWDIAKWPVLLLIVVLMLALLYWAAPNAQQPGFRWLTPGAAVAIVLWIVASALFALYVANFGSYNQTYGSLGAVIVFLIWLWITNLAILFGVELNSELERGRRIGAGHPREQEPFVPPRDESKAG